MILVDTSIWIDHLHAGDPHMTYLLNASQVIMHPFVAGELACGNLRNRKEILALLQQLPQATVATEAEVMFTIEQRMLMGQGIGYIDAHLLAATALSDSGVLWTRDKRLNKIAEKQGIAYKIP